MSFSDLGLSSWIVRQLSQSGVRRPTPIQTACIPPILSGSDCLGVAHTGSGKTLAFALPILQDLARDPYGIFALVLTPTRELADQIADQFRMVGKGIGLRDCVIVGGTDMVTQGKKLAERPHLVVAAPGRLADHLKSCDTFSLSKIKYLVLDEADRMLDGSFDEQLATIFKALPSKRRTLLFTATISEDLKKLTEVSMKKPFVFDASTSEEGSSGQITVDRLDQRYVACPMGKRKDGYLVHVLQKLREKDDKGSTIIFVRTIKDCQELSMTLNELGFTNVALNSTRSTKDRRAALAAFRSNHTRILVATDVASRGLDIPTVEFVVNHNVPTVTKNYVHRVGRTARAGRAGLSVTLVTPADVQLVEAIEGLIKTKLKEFEVNENTVAEIMTQVLVTRREQQIKLEEAEFEERREINRRKKLLRKGIDPDEEDRRIAREKRQRQKDFVKEVKRRKKKHVAGKSAAP